MITASELPFGPEGQSFVVEYEPATQKREANTFTVVLKKVATRLLSDLASFFSGVSWNKTLVGSMSSIVLRFNVLISY